MCFAEVRAGLGLKELYVAASSRHAHAVPARYSRSVSVVEHFCVAMKRPLVAARSVGRVIRVLIVGWRSFQALAEAYMG
jgi:hypothetical protein